MWKYIENKSPKGELELKVACVLKEMARYSFSTDADSFRAQFEKETKMIKRTNNFSADLLFKMTPRNQKSVEVWKLTVAGDFKYKLCTLTYTDNN